MTKETLTIKEAIEQGYTKYGFADREWQTTKDLHDEVFEEVDFEEHENLRLFEKESSVPSISENTISELLAEHISMNDSDNCGRDDDRVFNTVNLIDFTDTANKINKELEQHKYWMLTDIQLIK